MLASQFSRIPLWCPFPTTATTLFDVFASSRREKAIYLYIDTKISFEAREREAIENLVQSKCVRTIGDIGWEVSIAPNVGVRIRSEANA
jgi:hypothetical protein